MDKSQLIADIVTMWKKYGDDRQTLCYGVDRAHAKHIQEAFLSHGIPAGYVDSFTEMDERRMIAKQFADGDLRVICNVGVLTTGIDWDVRCIILARPTKSDKLFQQIIGRGLRIAEGKEDCIIIDHSDTHARLGFVTGIDEKYPTLCDGKPKESSGSDKEEPLPKECKKCHFMKPPKVHECPNCGFKPEKVSDVEHVDGDLQEITPGNKRNQQESDQQKKAFYGGLLAYANNKSYKEGWASRMYKDRYGVWPEFKSVSRPAQIPSDVAGFIKHWQIKQRHRRRKNAVTADQALDRLRGMLRS